MSKFRKKMNSLLALSLCVLLLGTTTIFAAGDCSLRVIIENEAGDPVPDINVELIQIARGEGSACTFTSDFTGLGISPQEILSSPTAAYAELVFQYAHARELSGQIKPTSSSGSADFTPLEKGIYLVFDRGEQAVAFQPYLVVLPTEIDGRQESNVISIPKTSETDVRPLLVMKLWDDNANAAGKRPNYIDVTVFCDGAPIRKVTLSDANDWQHMFYMLPVSGTYTVEEDPVTDYEVEYIPVAEGYIIFNKYTGTSGGGGGTGGGGGETPPSQPAHVSVRKIWDDENNAAGKRPSSITVQLIEGGTVIKTAVLSQSNLWAHTFTELDSEKSYTVQEIATIDYTATYSGNAAVGITITNTFTGETDPGAPPTPVVPEPGLFNIPVRVDWIDNNDAAGKRPGMTTVHLIANGGIVSTVHLRPDGNQERPEQGSPAVLSHANSGQGSVAQCLSFRPSENSRIVTLNTSTPDNSWEGVFSNVAADLSYTVWQPAVQDYTTTYSGNATEGFVVTNVYTEGVTDPGVPPDPTAPIDPDSPESPPVEIPPDTPLSPSIPQTGSEVLPVYLLMAAGVILVLLGIIDLYRGRKES